MNIVSGARISFGGLHLGHFLGCIQPLIDLDKYKYNYIFVLNDNPSQNRDAYLVDMLLDLYAIKNAFNIRDFYVVLDNQLLSEYYTFANYLRRNVTLAQLLSVYPKDTNNNYVKNSVNDFLFPIEQAMSYYLFDAERAFLNDDNLRFVTFASELAKKINNKDNDLILSIPSLTTGKIPHLLGYDYKKMSKANHNAIFLSDNLDIIQKKIYKLFDLSYLFKMYPKELDKFQSEYPYILPNEFLPFQYIKAFCNDMQYIENQKVDLRNSKNRKILREVLTDIIMNILKPIQYSRSKLSHSEVINQLSVDYIGVKNLIDDRFLKIPINYF